MRACFALCMAAALVVEARAECGACIEGRCYRQHHLRLSPDPSWPLDIDRYTNTLYDTDGEKFRQCQLDIFGRCYTWPHSWGIRRLTVDQRTGNTYGIIVDDTGSSNLYKVDLINAERELLVRGGVYTTFKDELYYVNYGDGIYSFKGRESRIVPGTEEYDVHSFIVDKKDDIYFETIWNNHYVIKRLSKGIVDRTVYLDNNYLMTTDSDGNAVFIDKKSHAVYKATDGQLVEVGVIRDLIYYTHMFDKPLFDRDNNLIYRSYLNDYIYLIRDRVANCTISISQNIRIITKTIISTEKYNKHDFTATTPTYYNIETTRISKPNGNIVANLSSNTPVSESSISNTPDGNTQDFDDNKIMFSSIPVPENTTSSSPNKNTKDYDVISLSRPASEPLTSNKPDANTKEYNDISSSTPASKSPTSNIPDGNTKEFDNSSIILSPSIPVPENSTISSPDANTKEYDDITPSILASESSTSNSSNANTKDDIMSPSIPIPENSTISSPDTNTKDYDDISPSTPTSKSPTSNKPGVNTKDFDDNISMSPSTPAAKSSSSSFGNSTKNYNDISPSTPVTEFTASTPQISDSSHSEPTGQEAHDTDDHNDK